MQHPFEGILSAGGDEPLEGRLPRRSFFGRAMGAVAGAAAAMLGAGRQVQAQSTQHYRRAPDVTTQALGEEGGYSPPPQYQGPVTTYALGEEGGPWPGQPPYGRPPYSRSPYDRPPYYAPPYYGGPSYRPPQRRYRYWW